MDISELIARFMDDPAMDPDEICSATMVINGLYSDWEADKVLYSQEMRRILFIEELWIVLDTDAYDKKRRRLLLDSDGRTLTVFFQDDELTGQLAASKRLLRDHERGRDVLLQRMVKTPRFGTVGRRRVREAYIAAMQDHGDTRVTALGQAIFEGRNGSED